MPNELIQVQLDTPEIGSGDKLTATVTYDSTEEHELTIECLGEFTLVPDGKTLPSGAVPKARSGGRALAIVLPPSAGREERIGFRMIRTSGEPSCLLTFTFYNELPQIVSVT